MYTAYQVHSLNISMQQFITLKSHIEIMIDWINEIYLL